MALIVKTGKADELLKKIKQDIGDGVIDTWEIDSDGDFTHVPDQWRFKAWMHPISSKTGNNIIFGIIGNKRIRMTKSLYAIYHGRFSEMLLTHFDDIIDSLEITSQKNAEDSF